MKIFAGDTSTSTEKVNFADKNNVVIGYDLHQQCCEDANWYLCRSLPSTSDDSIDPATVDLDSFVFDTSYTNDAPYKDSDLGSLPEATAFRLTNGQDELFLVLYNHHNGYYYHGFSIELSGVPMRTGTL